jgi:tetratricopeptide (TPR) repeat protein
MYAFGLEEQGRYRRSEKIAQHALEVNPFDCWARHALVHVMEMESRYQEGISFLEGSEQYWSYPENVFAGHLWWHMALFYIDVGDLDLAVTIYDNEIMPRLSLFQTKLVDGASLLWRLSLSGVNILDRWNQIVEWYEESNEQGFYAFNDMHAMLAYVGAGKNTRADELIREVVKAAEGVNSNARMEKLVGFPVILGIKAFGNGDYSNCIKELNAVRHCSHLFGGSHAQRDILWRTLIQAALLSGKESLLRELLNERLQLKPNCKYYMNLLNKLAMK